MNTETQDINMFDKYGESVKTYMFSDSCKSEVFEIAQRAGLSKEKASLVYPEFIAFMSNDKNLDEFPVSLVSHLSIEEEQAWNILDTMEPSVFEEIRSRNLYEEEEDHDLSLADEGIDMDRFIATGELSEEDIAVMEKTGFETIPEKKEALYKNPESINTAPLQKAGIILTENRSAPSQPEITDSPETILQKIEDIGTPKPEGNMITQKLTGSFSLKKTTDGPVHKPRHIDMYRESPE